MRDLVVLGTGGNAHDLFDVVEAINAVEQTWRIVGVLDDHRQKGSDFRGHPVLGGLGDAPGFDTCWFASSIWNIETFQHLHEILQRTRLPAERFATLVHPGASISSLARLGRGVIVNFGASVGANVCVGHHVSIGPGCIVGHDSTIASFTTVAPGAVISGRVSIGSNCYIGSRSVIRQLVAVGEGALVGMGAVVVANVESCSTTYGNPARPQTARQRK